MGLSMNAYDDDSEDNKDCPSRAAQIAAMAGEKLKALGQLPDVAKPKVVKAETTQAQQKRRELSVKLKSFWSE